MKRIITLVTLTLLLCGCSSHKDDGCISVHTDIQNAYLHNLYDSVNLYARGVEELSRPSKVKFTWNDNESNEYKFYLSTSSSYDNPLIYTVDTPSIEITNLMVNTEYFYKIEKDNQIIKEDTFKTKDEIIRNMYVSGVTNVRDLGGYQIQGTEKRIKQGLLFRSGRLNENNKDTPTAKITEKGKNTILNEMGLKCEIDLRKTSDNEVGGLKEPLGILGEQVNYVQCPMDYTISMMNNEHESVRKVFTTLGNRNNYPAAFHCSIGTDRTGFISYLILGYLGVSKENLYRDYLFSNFGNIGSKRTLRSIEFIYLDALDLYQGKSLKEKIHNYLLDIGVKQVDLDVLENTLVCWRIFEKFS